ncbi:MAG: hypothetical protein DRJ69_05160, partial [Thermoprotei archaeon]
MRSINVTLRIADPEKLDPMPFGSLSLPMRMVIKSGDGYNFELDLAGGWLLKITLSDGEVRGFLSYCKLPIPHSLVYVNGKSARTDLDGRFRVAVDEVEELHVDVIVPVQVCDALHKFLEAEKCKEPKMSLTDFLKISHVDIFRKYEELMDARRKRWRKVAASIN